MIRKKLVRERGFDNDQPSHLDRWKLDSTEGPNRMRKKLERNFNFYFDYPFITEELPDDVPPPPTSFDSKEYYLLNVINNTNNNIHRKKFL